MTHKFRQIQLFILLITIFYEVLAVTIMNNLIFFAVKDQNWTIHFLNIFNIFEPIFDKNCQKACLIPSHTFYTLEWRK